MEPAIWPFLLFSFHFISFGESCKAVCFPKILINSLADFDFHFGGGLHGRASRHRFYLAQKRWKTA